MSVRFRAVVGGCALALAGALLSVPARAGVPVVTVGKVGNEPIVAAAPDGTLYVAALTNVYRSRDGGASWTKLALPIFPASATSDSSLAVDPGGRVYLAFDWPYAGSTGVCTSDDRGDSWFCNPGVSPGVSDRMWVLAPTTARAYLVTNVGAYKPMMFTSTDRGTTWLPVRASGPALQPQTGPLLATPRAEGAVFQPYNSGDVRLTVFAPDMTTSSQRVSPLPRGAALPNAAFATDGTLWLASEVVGEQPGTRVTLARSKDLGATWEQLDPIGPATGAAAFSAVAAGGPDDVGVLYYWSETPSLTSTSATWSVKWARTTNARAPHPTWTVTTLETDVHVGPICSALTCMGNGRFAGDFIGALIDAKGVARLTWMKDRLEIRFASMPKPVPPKPKPSPKPKRR